MKIAVCIYGHLRTWNRCYKSLKKHLTDLYDCDVFLHTWSTIDHTTSSSWHGEKIKENINTVNLKEELIQKYQLKDIEIEVQENNENKYGYFYYDVPNARPVWSVRCLWHSINKSFELMQNYKMKNKNTEYDYILFIRPDLFLNEDIKIEKYIENISAEERKKSFFCFGRTVPDAGLLNEKHYYGGNDLLFFAAPDVISDLLDNVEYLFKYIKNSVTLDRTPESYILDIIENLNYKYYIIGFNKMIIVRGSTILPNDEDKIASEKTHLKKHQKALAASLKTALRLPKELLSTIYYLIKNK